MSYLTRDDSFYALAKMKSFHDELRSLMKKNGFDLLSNIGRRNILLSEAQEKFFTEALSRNHTVTCDGRTGEPDIMIESLEKELECKLTSRHRSGSISFQTDYETLNKKGKLDYLYVVADDSFEKFTVILYNDLTTEDFRPLSPGARGKTQMLKHATIDRANFLVGGLESINDIELSKLSEKLRTASTEVQKNKIKKSINYWEKTPTKFRLIMEEINA